MARSLGQEYRKRMAFKTGPCRGCFLVLGVLCGCHIFAQHVSDPAQPLDRWAPPEIARYLALENEAPHPRPAALGSRGMVAGTAHPLAIHAGLSVLQRGGNAADAALTTALAQIALNAGAAYSYAGIMNAIYFDAAAGQVYTLNANYNTPRNETEPMSIPHREPSGRTALVPGFMAGVQACMIALANCCSLRCLLRLSGLPIAACR